MINSVKQLIRQIEEHVNLYCDDKNGIAWIEDGRTGLGISVHSNIDSFGSISGMKARGYWGKKDRTVRSHGWIYNIDSFVCDKDDERKIVPSEYWENGKIPEGEDVSYYCNLS